MNASATSENLSRTYFFLFAIAGGAALSVAASGIGFEGLFIPYLGMLTWSAIPFWISRKVFKNKERTWTVLIAYVTLSALATFLYPIGPFLPFVAWPVFYAMRRNSRPEQSTATKEQIAAHVAHGPRHLMISGALSFAVLFALMAVSFWWGVSNGRNVKEKVAAFCNSVDVGDAAAGLDKQASAALKGDYAWSRLPSGEMELFVYKYSSFAKRGCTITATGGRVTDRQLSGQAL